VAVLFLSVLVRNRQAQVAVRNRQAQVAADRCIQRVRPLRERRVVVRALAGRVAQVAVRALADPVRGWAEGREWAVRQD